MATDTREEPRSPRAAMASSEADAKMVVATSRGDCQKLKDLVNQQDATTMLVVMTSSNQASPENSSPASMHPLLAAVASRGNREELNFLLDREGPEAQPGENFSKEFRNLVAAYYPGNGTGRSSVMQRATADVEEGINPAPLLEGVTVEGNTALHVVAANGDEQDFLDCADLIHSKDEGLLSKQNKKGDTPLHCAARAGNSQMFLRLIALAEASNIAQELLRQMNNSNETVLHEAVRFGDDRLVRYLLAADGHLACFPDEGSSPLYLAILLKEDTIAQILYDESEDHAPSYSGPNGQNVLHAAVLRGPELTRKVLGWNKDLTTERDVNGSTPLHFAAGIPREGWRRSVCSQVFKANTAALYQPDNDGLYPIHVAAAVGEVQAIAMFVKECPSSAGLRNAKGGTFLHVAVEKNKAGIVGFACRNRSLNWILNMQDDDGNTVLHLVVSDGNLINFSALFGNRQVNLNLTNRKGETPLDIAEYMVPPGLFYNQNSEAKIRWALRFVNATRGTSRKDHFQEIYQQKHGQKFKTEYEKKELKNVKESTQTLCIGSVLIATVTFGANFAMPGGYRADDHTHGGTPTLAGRYAFDGFVMANTLAFIFSSIATTILIWSGSPYFNIRSRKFYSALGFSLVDISVTCLAAAFALAAYVVLGSVAHKTAIAVCVLSLLVVASSKAEVWWTWAILAGPLFVRYGRLRSLLMSPVLLVASLLIPFWPFLIIFIWAAYGTSHPIATLESASAPAPAPFT